MYHTAGAASTPGLASSAPVQPVRVLVYSDDRNTRDAVRFGLGRRPARDLPPVEIVECATHAAVVAALDAGGVDVAILDGEAVPSGGTGLARQVKDEIYRAPPILVLTGRPQDSWLAAWSRADAVLSQPIDPVALCRSTADLIRRRLGASPPDNATLLPADSDRRTDRGDAHELA